MQNFDVICFGEVLWDVFNGTKIPGGAPANVCYHLNKAGISATLISCVGDDDDGRNMVSFLNKNAVNTDYIAKNHHLPTGLVIANLQPNRDVHYDIKFPSAWDEIVITDSETELIKKAKVLVFGSLALRSELSKKSLFSLLKHAKTSVFDINLRSPFYSKELIEECLKAVNILKTNEDELQILAQWFNVTFDVKSTAEWLLNNFNLDEIIITKGKDGAAYLNKQIFINHPGYKVNVIDTVGSGDSFLAAFIAGKLTHKTPENILDNACKTGSFVATKNGGMPEYTLDEIG